MPTNEERGFQRAIRENPKDVASYLAYDDWLEEQGRPYDALKQRVKAGVSETRYKIRRKSDGMYSDGGWPIGWSETGKNWRRLGDVRGHFTACYYKDDYAGTPWSDIEVVVYEVRVQPVVGLPVSKRKGQWREEIVVHEPGDKDAPPI